MTIASSIRTAEQLIRAKDIGRCELVRGELIMMSPAGANHGLIASRIDRRLGTFVEQHRLGEAFGAETGFLLSRNPDTVRAPDVAFVKKDRLNLLRNRGFFPGHPDLAIEVLSPEDSASEVLAKVRDWLEAGTSAVWIVDPIKRTVTTHRSDQPSGTLTENEVVHDDAVIRGFKLALAEVFREA
jgi:Uma2 family endonuclease